MTDTEKITLATSALVEVRTLARQPWVPFEARARLVEIHELTTRKLAELGVSAEPAEPAEPAAAGTGAEIIDKIFEANEVTADQHHYVESAVVSFTRTDGISEWLSITGHAMTSVKVGHRYRITVEEA